MSVFQQPLPSKSLPDWMRRAQRGVDWGLVLVLVICLTVSAPFAVHSELPHNNASENYVYRTNDFAESIQEGWLYPRWSPNVLGGYGAPIPNFYPPAPTYLAAVIQVLLTNNAVSAVRMAYIVATCIAGIFMYMFVMRRSNAAAGILAATLYVYSPYVSLVVPHVLGDLPEMFILAFTPALLWASDRLIKGQQPQNMLLVTLFAAALFLTDPKPASVSCLLVGAFVVWDVRRQMRHTMIIGFLTAVGLGVLISSFYWLPAVLETSAIHWQANIPAASPMLRIGELMSPLSALDPMEMVHYPQLTLGIVVPICAIGGAIAHLYIYRRADFGLVFLFFGLCIVVLAVTLLKYETWLVGLATLCLSICGADLLVPRAALSPRAQRLLLPILMIGVWIGSRASWTPPGSTQAFGRTDGWAQIEYEQQGNGFAVLPAGTALPTSISSSVAFNHSLIESYQSGTINKLVPGQISGAVQASPLAHFIHGDRFQVRFVAAPTTLDFLTAYFPGWRAAIGEQRVNLRAAPETGLIQVDVPPLSSGNAELSITLGPTDVRTGSWLISGFTVCIVLLFTWRQFRVHKRSRLEDLVLLRQDEARLIAVPVGCFALTALLFLIPNPFFTVSQPVYSGIADSYSTPMRSNAGLTMNGFHLTKNVFAPGDDLDITLFWQTQRFLASNYQVRIYLKNNSNGAVANLTPLRNPGFYPTRRWNTQQYVPDVYQIPLAETVKPGNYQIHVEAFDCMTACNDDSRLDFFNPDGQPLGADLTLPTLISIS